MTYKDNEASVTISRQRYAELVIAEADAKRLKAVIYDAVENYHNLSREELKVLCTLLDLKEEEE